MGDWLKRKENKISVDLGVLKGETSKEEEEFDAKGFANSIDSIYNAVTEGGVNFCPTREIIERASEKWNRFDIKLKKKIKFIAGKCG